MRRDLRALRICSIDPPTARDLDDALRVTLHHLWIMTTLDSWLLGCF